MSKRNPMVKGNIYFLTCTVTDWVDVFTRSLYKHILVDSLNYCCKNKGLNIYAWCLMSNHLHMIAGADDNKYLPDILRDFKKFTSKEIVKAIQENPESRREWMLDRFQFKAKFMKHVEFKFWQEGNESKEIHSEQFLLQKIDYIHNNPVVAEIVDEAMCYKYSSACDYAGEKGLIDVIMV
ncbi:REP-associated tyrosine transposase [Marinifilum sp.]|uniref:REP-associated tyrosine transposase n=1 Tax=Marinifilum sp. TaxID=2033137 RepID=UPI003BAA7B0B